ncbi:MAG: phosphoglycerate kinase [Actinobacteria bacterium 21-73-9]|nr:MAG: phosphoglycerate kinase [Actinobacteria bacterium 21-73-9]
MASPARWGDLTGKRVLVRVDFNVPVAERNGEVVVTDDFRLRATLPLLSDLLGRGASVVACTHFGRPEGRADPRYSVEPVRRALEALCPGVELMENLRFNPGEEACDPTFGASLVEGVDYYVNEAFGASHRAHASIMVPPTLVPSAAGPNLAHEAETILALLESPRRPFVAIVGGAKVRDKIGLVRVLAERADLVLVGGGMAHTFALADGRRVGDSLVDPSWVEECRTLLKSGTVVIPLDARGLPTGAPFGPSGGEARAVDFAADVPDGFSALDIGPDTVEVFTAAIEGAGSILWNGPMGVFEDPRFMVGTKAVAQAVAASDAVSVVGGGDSAAALDALGLREAVTFVSTGGGATLRLVEEGDLPGLRALRESPFA